MDEVLYSVESGIGAIVINRPDQRNALNPAVLAGIRAALESGTRDPEVRVLTVTGTGEKVFCAGADLKASLAGPGSAAASGFGRSEYRELLVQMLRCPKPTVAIARGHVMAGGLGIFLSCDLTLACDDIHLSTPEIHVGMFPMMVYALLCRHVGRKKAAELVFLGERIPASEAKALGLVNQVYERAHFERKAAEVLEKLSAKSRRILELGKDAMRSVETLSLVDSLAYMESALERVMACEDSKEGIEAFLEKRTPVWKDR